jgi:hypothetical protein
LLIYELFCRTCVGYRGTSCPSLCTNPLGATSAIPLFIPASVSFEPWHRAGMTKSSLAGQVLPIITNEAHRPYCCPRVAQDTPAVCLVSALAQTWTASRPSPRNITIALRLKLTVSSLCQASPFDQVCHLGRFHSICLVIDNIDPRRHSLKILRQLALHFLAADSLVSLLGD